MNEVVKICKCPICGKVEKTNEYKPFCSKRCADIDLGNWFNETYTIPVVELDEQEIEQIEKTSEEPKK